MIAYLSGSAMASDVILVGGVGYAVKCPTPLPVGTDVAVFVRTTMSSEQITLWAFTTEQERDYFDALCKVTKVGPSTALAVLAAISPAELSRAVASKDVAAISSAKGVGKKTAELIVAFAALPGAADADADGTSELAAALTGLGFSTDAVESALVDIAAEGVDMSDADLALPAALARLGTTA